MKYGVIDRKIGRPGKVWEITICCYYINILVRHYGRLVLPWGMGQHEDIIPVTLINFLSVHKSNSLKLRSFPVKPLSQNDKDFSAPIVPFISLIGFIHSRNCSIFLQRFLIQPRIYFTRNGVDMKYRYLQFAKIWNTILRNAVNCCSARIPTLQSNCFQYTG